MRTKAIGSLLALTAAVIFGTRSICEDAPRLEKEVRRYHEVTPELHRGGQPTRAGFELLKQKGIKTVINLRREKDERELIEELGMKYVSLPLNAWDRVSEEDIEKFLSVVDDPSSQPVFVHCRRGADRTGFMIGVYRITRQGWSAERAYQEAREIGIRWWYRGLKNQLFEIAKYLQTTAEANSADIPLED